MSSLTGFALRLSLIVLLCIIHSFAQAQKATDQIFKKDGTTVPAKVLEITTTEIKYKKASNPDGPTYTILKTDAIKIVYANGETENYSGSQGTTKTESPKAEIQFGADNFVSFSNDGKDIITDLTFPDQNTYLCYWTYDSKLQRKIPFENRRSYQGVYNWQMFADDGSYLKAASLFSSNNQLVTTFINPETKQPFGQDANGSIISPNGKRILIKTGAGKGYVYTFDNNGTLLKTMKNGSWVGIGAWRFSHNSAYYMISLGKGLRKAGLVSIFDADGNAIGEIPFEDIYEDLDYYPYNRYGEAAIKSFMDFSFDDKLIIAPYNDKTVGIWDLKGSLVKSLPHYKAKVAAISRDGKMVVTVGGMPFGKVADVDGVKYSGGQIKIWTTDGSLIKEIPFPANPSSVVFTPDNSGFVVAVDGFPIWLWGAEDYKLPDGYDKSLVELAQYQEQARASQRASEKRARQSNMWGGFAEGFVRGMAKYDQAMGKSNSQSAAQEKFIKSTVTKALVDCHYVVFTQIDGDYIMISEIFKINKGCELNTGGSNFNFTNTREEAVKWIKATIAKEEKDNGRGSITFDEWNNHFKNAKYVDQGGCLCK